MSKLFVDSLKSKISLGLKFSILLAFTMSITSATLGYIIYQYGFESLENELRHGGIQIVTNIADRNAPFLDEGVKWEIYRSVRGVMQSMSRLKDSLVILKYATIIDKSDKVIAHSNEQRFPRGSVFEIKGDFLKEFSADTAALWSEEIPGEANIYHITAPMIVRGEKLGTAIIGISKEGLMSRVKLLEETIILTTLILVTIAILLGNYFSKQILKPLKPLSTRLQALPENIIKGVTFNKTSMTDEIALFTIGFDTIISRYENNVKELMIEKQKLNSILNGVNAGMIVIDRDFNVVWQNRIHAQWFGDRQGQGCTDENHCCPLHDACPPKDVFENENVLSVNITKTIIGGEHKVFNVIASPLHDETGAVVSALELSIDISLQAEMEEKINKNKQLASMGQMAAGMAHEIRNPLSALIAALHLILKHNKPNEEHDERLLTIIDKESDRLNNVLTDFLSFATTRKPNRRPYDLNLIINEILDVLIQQKGKDMNIDFKRDLHYLPQALVDENLLKQVVWNLAINGIESMEESGGVLSISTSRDNGHINIIVKDTGIGMDNEAVQSCFEPFYTHKKSGTGLGLAIVKRIVNEHNGKITVASQKGKGTQFCITLPYEI